MPAPGIVLLALSGLGASDRIELSRSGVRALQKFAKGDTILEFDAGEALSEPNTDNALPRLAIRLVLEGAPTLRAIRAPDSLHRWNARELSALEWPELEAAARMDAEMIASIHRELAPKDMALDDFSHAFDVCRGHVLISTDSLYLLPGVDAFSSSPRGLVKLDQADGQGSPTLRLVVSSEASPGDLLALPTGWRTNDELLLEQGFACDDLPSDAIRFEREVVLTAAREAGVVDESLSEMHDEIIGALCRLQYLDLTRTAEQPVCVFSGGFASDSLGVLLQAICVQSAELEPLKTERKAFATAVNIGEGVPLSLENERRVGIALAALCRRTLGSFSSTLSADEQALGALEQAEQRPGNVGPALGYPTSRAAEALRARVSRKRCLKACAEKCASWIERPTVIATMRRPWKAAIRVSG